MGRVRLRPVRLLHLLIHKRHEQAIVQDNLAKVIEMTAKVLAIAEWCLGLLLACQATAEDPIQEPGTLFLFRDA